MKEPYGEELATHTDPESCEVAPEGQVEALTGARAGRVLSRENQANSGMPTTSGETEGNTINGDMASRCIDPTRSQTPRMLGSSSYGNQEIPCLTFAMMEGRSAP
jgi:RNA-directed DNA polymerase